MAGLMTRMMFTNEKKTTKLQRGGKNHNNFYYNRNFEAQKGSFD